MSIEVMKQAVDALDEAANVLTSSMFADAAAALREAIEQAEKPVAWMYVNTDGECEQIEYGLCDFDDPSIQLLYTAPRQWVGLTEIEICDIEADELTSASSETFSFARAIEAKLKEKNT
jgi:hypothetical protein